MGNSTLVRWLMAAVMAQFALAGAPALAQGQTKGGGKIVCWKDKSGKVIGCGDTVPPEYQSSATKELDQRGITRKTTESAEEAARRRAEEQQRATERAAEEKRAAEQKRQDSALLNSYTSAAEIDQRRDRDLQPINLQLSQLQATLKTASASDKPKFEQSIKAKEKEKDDLIQKYAVQKKRYEELKGVQPGAPAPAPAASAPAPAPAKK